MATAKPISLARPVRRESKTPDRDTERSTGARRARRCGAGALHLCFPALLCGLAAALLGPVAAQASHLPPDPNYVPYEPALSVEERGLLGLINDERARHGVAPLRHSLTLADAADRYANYLKATRQGSHDAYGSPSDRMRDAGWPSTGAYWGEVLDFSADPTGAFEDWMGSSLHRDILLNPRFDSIGIARRDNVWLADLGDCPNDPSLAASCQLTDDIGDSSLAIDPEPPEDTGTPAKLRLKAKRRGQRALLTFTLPAGDGGLQLVASKAGKERSRALEGSGKVKTKLRLSRGRWTVEATSDSASVCRVLNMKRLRGKQASRRWDKVKTRPCSKTSV